MDNKLNYTKLNKFVSVLVLFFLIFSLISINTYVSAWEKMVYPLKEISKLDCRFEKFSNLSSNCKQPLPIVKTKDYEKYAKLNWWFNDYTRLYSVLWSWSYTYGWDVWNWWHIWVDIATAEWTPVYNIYQWTVISAKKWLYTWNIVSIEHLVNWKKIVSNYMHLSKIDVKKWQKVKTWIKIWEVWSTWNSTWNHLHFQIDYDTAPFHPFYYNPETCPYSNLKMNNTSVCSWELKQNTIDPLLFLETQWAILNDLKIEKVPNVIAETPKESKETKDKKTEENLYDFSIFDRTVYIWYDKTDIKKVQQIFKDLWEYNWDINWNYNDIVEDLIDYQVKTWVIETRYSVWAWRFGPKTRKQTKSDYREYLLNDLENIKIVSAVKKEDTEEKNTTKIIRIEEPKVIEIEKNKYKKNDKEKEKIEKKVEEKKTNTTVVVTSNVKTQNIPQKNIMSREEIKAQELKDFLNDYNIDLKLEEIGWNVKIWKTIKLNLSVTDKKKWRAFKWNIPSAMTFETDFDKVKIFPTKLYNFRDWKRDIDISWKSIWNTTLKVKIWNEVIKSFKIKAYSDSESISISSWEIFTWWDTVLSEEKSWFVAFNDSSWQRLLNIKYEWKYKLKTNDWVEICIKKWSLDTLEQSFTKECADYKNGIEFTYEDTTGWLLLFNYKAKSQNASIELIDKKTNKVIEKRSLTVQKPKWLDNDYLYKDEVIEMLKKWVVDWIDNWYFLQDNWLTQLEWINWIKNTLEVMKDNTNSKTAKSKIDKNLKELESFKAKRFEELSREEFLKLSYKYLIIEDTWSKNSIKYIDLENRDNEIANAIFNKNSTWKDRFWDSYYRPKIKITRWEWAYLLATVLNRNQEVFLTMR